MAGLLEGKKVLVTGVLDRRSIAYSAARLAAEQGAEIFFVPFTTDERYGYLRVRYCAQARCIENHVYVALAGNVGNLPDVDNMDVHYAQSGLLTPCDIPFSRDAIAAECTPNIETVIVEDVDLELLSRHRQTGNVLNWKDRRTDLYEVRLREPAGGAAMGRAGPEQPPSAGGSPTVPDKPITG